MEPLGVTRKDLNRIEGYLLDWRQKVQLEGVQSSWQDISAGIPKSSILGPLFLLIYTHDLPGDIQAVVECDQYADLTPLCCPFKWSSPQRSQKCSCLTEWRLQINASKTYAMEITGSTLPHPKQCVRLWDSNNELTNRQKHLSLVITSTVTLMWKKHTASILQKARESLESFAGSDVPQPHKSCNVPRYIFATYVRS